MAITRSQFRENGSDLTTRAEESLRANFATQADPIEEALGLGGEFEKASRQNFYASGSEESFKLHQDEIAVGQGQLERGQVNAQINEARAGIEALRAAQDEKSAQRHGDIMLLMLLDQLHAMEDALAEQYGESFAEDLLSDLQEQGLVDQDEYDRIMGIHDQDERRQAIAKLIQEKLDSGELQSSNLQGHPWAQEWLQQHNKVQQQIQAVAENAVETGRSLESLDKRVINRAEEIKAQQGIEIDRPTVEQKLQFAEANSSPDDGFGY